MDRNMHVFPLLNKNTSVMIGPGLANSSANKADLSVTIFLSVDN